MCPRRAAGAAHAGRPAVCACGVRITARSQGISEEPALLSQAPRRGPAPSTARHSHTPSPAFQLRTRENRDQGEPGRRPGRGSPVPARARPIFGEDSGRHCFLKPQPSCQEKGRLHSWWVCLHRARWGQGPLWRLQRPNVSKMLHSSDSRPERRRRPIFPHVGGGCWPRPVSMYLGDNVQGPTRS